MLDELVTHRSDMARMGCEMDCSPTFIVGVIEQLKLPAVRTREKSLGPIKVTKNERTMQRVP